MSKTRLRPITEDDILELPAHVGDHIGKDYRLELHHEAKAEHEANRNDDGDPGWRCELVSGPKGSGKSTFAGALALQVLPARLLRRLATSRYCSAITSKVP